MPVRPRDHKTYDPSGHHRLLTLSATFRELPTSTRESVARSLNGMRAPFSERVCLHTCHRVELVGLLAEYTGEPDIRGVSIARGRDAAERVFLVAGGLDSAVLAEEQILGQVRDAYATALDAAETGPILNELLQRAIGFGKRVRSEVQPRTDRSLADRAVRWAVERLGAEARPAAALVIGTGEMGRLLAHRMAIEGMTLSIGSRSLERARRLLAELPNAARHRALGLDEALADAGRQDLVAIAVRSAAVPLDLAHLASARPLPLAIDLSAPPAVTPAAAALLDDRLLDLDRLGALSSTRPLSHAAERRLREAAREGAAAFMTWWDRRASGDGIGLLHAHAAAVRQRHLARLQRRLGLTDDQLAAVDAATAAMVGELLHEPTIRLQREPAARSVVARVFGLEA